MWFFVAAASAEVPPEVTPRVLPCVDDAPLAQGPLAPARPVPGAAQPDRSEGPAATPEPTCALPHVVEPPDAVGRRFRIALAGASEGWTVDGAVFPTLAGHLTFAPGLRAAPMGLPNGSVGRMDRPVRIWLDGVLIDSNLL